MRAQLFVTLLALSVVAGCGDREQRDREQVRERPGDAALIGSEALRRHFLRHLSQAAQNYEFLKPASRAPADITDRFLSHGTAKFCALDAATKRGHQAYEVVGMIPPATAQGWATQALEDAVLADTCGMRLFMQAREGRAIYTAVYNILPPGSAARRRSISGPGARLIVVLAPRGPAASFPTRAARLAGALVPVDAEPSPEALWTIDGDQETVLSAHHRRALLAQLAARLSAAESGLVGPSTVELTSALIGIDTAPFCAMSSADKRSFDLRSIRLSGAALKRIHEDLLAKCRLRIFAQRADGQTRLAAIYNTRAPRGTIHAPRLREGPVSLDVVVFDEGLTGGPPP